MRRITIAVGARANWASVQAVHAALAKRPDVDLSVLAFASALLDRYGCVADTIPGDVYKMPSLVEGGEPRHMAMTSGLVLGQAADALATLASQIVYVVGDRYEVLPLAYAGLLTNRIVAHQMGGELSGTVDESIRHSITKLSHWHFVATEQSADRVVQMGEARDRVWVTGCPRLDVAREFRGLPRGTDVLVMYHPVTTEWEDAGRQAAAVIEGVLSVAGNRAVHIFWPNADAGTELIVKATKRLVAGHETHRNLPAPEFLKRLATCAVLVGNSSAGIREAGFLGTPVVNVGTRQQHRERGPNVVDCEATADAVAAAVALQLSATYEPSDLYGTGYAAGAIAEVLATETLANVQKEWAA